MSWNSPSVVVVGTVAFDSIKTPFGERERIVGGAGTYIGWSASRLGMRTGLVSVIGEDFPKTELENMAEAGMNLEGVACPQGGKSFFWSGSYHMDMNGRDTLATDLNVLIGWEPKVAESGKTAEFVMLGNLDPAVQGAVLDQITSPKLVVLDTMNFWMDVALEPLKKVIGRVDVLTVNDEEARQLTGEHFLPKAARAIHAMGPKTVVIKKGEHGALMFQGEHTFFAPAYPLEKVTDPTGAGDTFAGGFVGHLAAQHEAHGEVTWDHMKQAMTVGSVMASFTCEAFGTEGIAQLTASDVKERWSAYRALTDCGTVSWPQG